MEMAKTVLTVDLDARIAAKIFAMLNRHCIIYLTNDPFSEGSNQCALISSQDPKDLYYPEGWYYAKGTFRNKGNTSTGTYEEVPIYRIGGLGECW